MAKELFLFRMISPKFDLIIDLSDHKVSFRRLQSCKRVIVNSFRNIFINIWYFRLTSASVEKMK